MDNKKYLKNTLSLSVINYAICIGILLYLPLSLYTLYLYIAMYALYYVFFGMNPIETLSEEDKFKAFRLTLLANSSLFASGVNSLVTGELLGIFLYVLSVILLFNSFKVYNSLKE